MSSICPISACVTKNLARLQDCVSDCKTIALRISENIALYILFPLATSLLTYCLVPAAWTVIAVPVVAIGSVAATYFWFQKTLPEPLPPGAPRGIANGSANCWVNSLFQMLHADRHVREWLLSGACPVELLAFQNFMKAYEQAYAEGLSLVNSNSQELRTCLAALMQKPGIHFEASKEGDPTEGWMLIQDRLPDPFKAKMIQIRHYAAGEGQPQLKAWEADRAELLPTTAHLSLPIVGQNSSLATLMDAYCNVPADGSHLNINGIPYLKSGETILFLSAPLSLWIDFKRFNGKHSVDIVLPDTYVLQLEDGRAAPYLLTSFAVHSGEDNRGHYISFRKGPGDGRWYQISDSQVTRMSAEEVRAQSQKAYFVQYSRVS